MVWKLGRMDFEGEQTQRWGTSLGPARPDRAGCALIGSVGVYTTMTFRCASAIIVLCTVTTVVSIQPDASARIAARISQRRYYCVIP